MLTIRSKTSSRVPTARIGLLAIAVIVVLVVAGGAFLALFEPRPPIKHYEVPVSNDRLAR